MKKAIILIIFLVTILTSSSCIASRDRTYNDRDRDDNRIVIKQNRRHNDRNGRIKIRKEKRRGHINRIDNDEPVIIIDKNK